MDIDQSEISRISDDNIDNHEIVDISDEVSNEVLTESARHGESTNLTSSARKLGVDRQSRKFRIPVTIWILVTILCLSALVFEVVLWGQTGFGTLPKIFLQVFVIIIIITALSQIIVIKWSNELNTMESITNLIHNYTYNKNTRVSPT
ncbi:uncharacterized protein LOC111616136 [Centruroides sculpturatus]|uniref:uncharacterized protein LOC111616136 n=1 Tax=Centruroides sculpturatus TaxID=218467 RepID=UPI000C6E1732|nr:uncharacterized protein LOC111616136 [Centruroides sculpturatus]XP_023213329.1 uncharacterized protein LOC111616136 [Centruroides sculpturatus]